MFRFKYLFILAVTLSWMTSCTTTNKFLAGETKNEYLKKEYSSLNRNLPYRIIYPEKGKKKYPLLIFMHGAGERGNDNEKQLIHGSEWVKKNLLKYPMVAVFPQCATDDFWSNVNRMTDSEGRSIMLFNENKPKNSMLLALGLIDSLSNLPYVDKERIYIMGLSMGGMATFEMMWRRPGLFAAAAPICGGGFMQKAREMAMTKNIWVFHGDADPIVPVSLSQDLVREIKKHNASIKYTEYKGVGHDSWDKVFLEPDFFKWLSKSKNK